MEKTYNAVAYCDGGARPTNPGYGGYGIHGYVYSNEESKKGIGHADWKALIDGYALKAEQKEENPVNVVSYFDIHATVDEICSNNVSEAKALITTLQSVPTLYPQYKINKINVYTDNEGVVTSCNTLLEKWEKNGWRKTNGEPLANLELRKQMLSVIREFKSNHELEVKWIKGHSGNLGNETADKLATVGCTRRMRNNTGTKVSVSDPQGYWSFEHERHPLIIHKTMYFSTIGADRKPGHYRLGSHGKDDTLAGSKMADGYHAYVIVNEPDVAVESVINYQTQVCAGEFKLVLGHLDNILNQKTYAQIIKFNQDALYQATDSRQDLWCVGKVPVTRILDPMLIGYRAMEKCTFLSQLLECFTGDKDKLEITEITDEIYTTVKSKPSLKSQFVPGFTKLKLKVKTPGDKNEKEIFAVMGLDIPGRNALKKLEGENPKLYAVTWSEGEQAWRYAFIVITDKAKAAYSGCFTNLVLRSSK